MSDAHHSATDPTSLRRRDLLRLAAVGVALAAHPAAAQQQFAWDKTFSRDPNVEHVKVSFFNRLGIELVADVYTPKVHTAGKLPALVVGHPYGAVKEQSSGLYAQAMAARGFVCIAFDASYNGESGGQPRATASPEAFVEDFSAAVDFLGTLDVVDRQRIGVIGVCGSGGFALAAAEIDPRLKAIATVSMYDIGQARRQGLAKTLDVTALHKTHAAIAEQRWAEVDGAPRAVVIGTPEQLSSSSSAIDREFFAYYRTPRGQHPRSTTALAFTSGAAMTLFSAFEHLDWLAPRPVLFITGEHAHSRHFSEQAFARAVGDKQLHVVKGAGHVDLYDRVELIPWDALTSFFRARLD
jgi:fermentation-respiration switch protein FrsA (DUF1100 family)